MELVHKRFPISLSITWHSQFTPSILYIIFIVRFGSAISYKSTLTNCFSLPSGGNAQHAISYVSFFCAFGIWTLFSPLGVAKAAQDASAENEPRFCLGIWAFGIQEVQLESPLSVLDGLE